MMSKPRVKPTRRYLVALGGYGLVWAVLLGGGYFLAAAPQAERLRSLETQLRETEDRLADARAAQSQETRERLAEEREQIAQRLGNFVADAGRAASVTFQMGQMAAQVGVSDFVSQRKATQSQESPEGVESLEEVWIDVSFDGSFNKFAQLVNQLERNDPVLFVEQFTIRKLDRHSEPEASIGLAFLVAREQVAQAQ